MKNKGISGMRIGFDNDRYLKIQSEHIKERINQFGDKLYLEFGGKLFDDYHASRVLPGFAPDSKLQMLMHPKDLCTSATVRSYRSQKTASALPKIRSPALQPVFSLPLSSL